MAQRLSDSSCEPAEMEEESKNEKPSEAGFFCTAYFGLRCFLLLVVMEGHYWFEEFKDERLNPLSFSVPCFFALSGYLISHTLYVYEDKMNWKQAFKKFYWRRFLRILPPFYLVLVVTYFVGNLPYFWWQATYLMNFKIWHLSVFDPFPFQEYMMYGDFRGMHLWSIAVEEQFYILFPIFVFAIGKRFRTAALILGILMSIGIRLYFLKYYPHSFYGGLTVVIGEYILWACLFAWFERHGRLRWLCNPQALYASVVAFGLLAYFDRSYGMTAQWKPLAHQTIYALIIAVLVMSMRHSPKSYLCRALSLKPVMAVGSLSYGAYLIHIFMNPVADWLGEALPFLILFPQCPKAVTGPIVTLAGASVMYVFFEKPIGNLRKRWTPR